MLKIAIDQMINTLPLFWQLRRLVTLSLLAAALVLAAINGHLQTGQQVRHVRGVHEGINHSYRVILLNVVIQGVS